ncbi:M6 family metalloprotease domain-containing protein [Streptomyces niger]|uniref:M6 family metalloprotease domain-containing protein n=1 Tax=Streptomyces niger TaxID=66373 RepID=UPI000699996B|nr:M6 family metalloprotease domain-containing protein [Streptomyces niger]
MRQIPSALLVTTALAVALVVPAFETTGSRFGGDRHGDSRPATSPPSDARRGAALRGRGDAPHEDGDGRGHEDGDGDGIRRAPGAAARHLPASSSSPPPGTRGAVPALPAGPCALPGSVTGVSEAAATPPGFVRPTGRVRALTVLIDFPDVRAGISPRERYGEFFPAATRFFRGSSYGMLDYRSTPVLKWFRMSRPLASYRVGRGTSFSPASKNGYYALAKEIVHAVDRTVDFRAYDLVNVLVTPQAGPPATENVWSVTFSGGPLGLKTGDGTHLKNVSFIWSRQTGPSAYRVLNHENAHSFGLPDLYFTDGRADPHPVGHWDPMDVDWGPENDFLGWHKWKLGWLAPDQVDCVHLPGSVTTHRLTAATVPGGTKITVVPVSKHRAYVVEARRAGPLDPTACRPGVLVYRVATDVPSGKGPVRVFDATPKSAGCFQEDPNVRADLTDATYRPGQTFRADGVSVRVLEDHPAAGSTGSTADTFRVRITTLRQH